MKYFDEYSCLEGRYPGTIIVYQVGEFFEILGDSAKLVSGLLGLTLTKRHDATRGDTHMCGIPKNHVDRYAAKMVGAGLKVVKYAQIVSTGNIVRDIIRIFTPGTLMECEYLPEFGSRYLACVYHGSVAWADASTGAFYCDTPVDLVAKLYAISPVEAIVLDDTQVHIKCVTRMQPPKNCKLTGFNEYESAACAAILQYINSNQRPSEHSPPFILQMQTPEFSGHNTVVIDQYSARSLEVFSSTRGVSLLRLLSAHVATSMGHRTMRNMLMTPSTLSNVIKHRQDCVDILFNLGAGFRQELRSILRGIRDIERAITRIVSKRGVAYDLVIIKSAMRSITQLPSEVRQIDDLGFHYAPAVIQVLDAVVDYDSDAGVIRPLSHPVLAEMHEVISSADNTVAKMASALRGFYSAQSLKICKNHLLGYYIEIAHKDKDQMVGNDLILRQSLLHCVRYSTPELREFETKFLRATAAINAVESEIVEQIFFALQPFSEAIQSCARSISKIDAFNALAELAGRNGYVRPLICEDKEITILNGCNPILLDQLGACVASDTCINEDMMVMVLTAPNMSGKSVFLRQIALITLMAHIGSFVPAHAAKIGLVDRIFCRAGADDDMSVGHSTFMQEMVETALIVNHATEKSLVIIDELGRGTSTRDGIAIAYSVIEHLHNKIGCRAVIATHYHELVGHIKRLRRVGFYTFDVSETDGEIVFSRSLRQGVAESSYGILVARMAGLTAEVIQRASEFLSAGE